MGMTAKRTPMFIFIICTLNVTSHKIEYTMPDDDDHRWCIFIIISLLPIF